MYNLPVIEYAFSLSLAYLYIQPKPIPMNLIEKIISAHSHHKKVKPGDIVNISIDTRIARDFGGSNVVKNMLSHELTINDSARTFFTFDCNPGGSDQKYAENQSFCRRYAYDNNIRVYDINSGIGTHLAIDMGLIAPGGTLVSTDSHANITGAIGAFGQGMGDKDIAAVWSQGTTWFKVPETTKITLTGHLQPHVSAKDIALNILHETGTDLLLQKAVEMAGEGSENLSLDQRITIASMATEMGAIIILFPPSKQIANRFSSAGSVTLETVYPDDNATYSQHLSFDISRFNPMVALPGSPHKNLTVEEVRGTRINSAFIGSCTNGRIEDLRAAAAILKGKKTAPGIVLKIVPSTDAIWQQALNEGLIKTLKDAGALIANAGCAGCAAGQIGQNGTGEVTISTGNRNYKGKQGNGDVYLASPAVVAASAIAGYITTPDAIPQKGSPAQHIKITTHFKRPPVPTKPQNPMKGRIWFILKDDIDTDMIFHNRYLTITNEQEMGQYTFDNLDGWQQFAQKVQPGDIIFTGKNFGAGSSRQQAVDCFKSLGVAAIIAQSFGAIYERNAINAAFPVLKYNINTLLQSGLKQGDLITLNLYTGIILRQDNKMAFTITPFNEIQKTIFQRGGLLAPTKG